MIMAKDLAPAKVKDFKSAHPYDCVLLIDDDEITNFLNEDILNSLDLSTSIRSTKSVDEALKFLYHCLSTSRQSSILVILDLIMATNSKNGFDFLEEFREYPDIAESNIDIIVLTNSLDKIHKQKAEKFNIINYVAKPLSAEKIQISINKKLNVIR